MPRRAFAISPVLMVLCLVLCGILAWKYWYQYDLIPAAHPRAAAAKSHILWSNLRVLIVTGVVAAAVGTGCYFAFRRSHKAFNVAASCCVTIPIALLSIQAYNTMVSPRPKQAPVASSSSSSPPLAAEPAAGSTQAFLKRTREQMEQLNQRSQEAQRSLSQRPAAPSPPSTTQPLPSSPPPVPATPLPAPSPSPPAPTQTPARQNPQPRPSTPSPELTRAMEKLESDINAEIHTALTAVEPVLTHIAKPPRADRSDLKKRTEETAAAKAKLESISKRLRDVIAEARAAFDAIDPDRAASESHRFAQVINAHQRAFACDSLARTLDQGAEEAQLLLDNYGKWKTTRDSTIESKDFQLQSRANSARFFIDSWLQRKNAELASIRGK